MGSTTSPNGAPATTNGNGAHPNATTPDNGPVFDKLDFSKGFDFAGNGQLAALTQPPKHDTVEAERAYLKERLVAALRIFAQQGFDHGVVSPLFCYIRSWIG